MNKAVSYLWIVELGILIKNNRITHSEGVEDMWRRFLQYIYYILAYKYILLNMGNFLKEKNLIYDWLSICKWLTTKYYLSIWRHASLIKVITTSAAIKLHTHTHPYTNIYYMFIVFITFICASAGMHLIPKYFIRWFVLIGEYAHK